MSFFHVWTYLSH